MKVVLSCGHSCFIQPKHDLGYVGTYIKCYECEAKGARYLQQIVEAKDGR